MTDPYRPPPDLAAVASRLFGDRLELAVRYADLLASEGVARGLVGPREAPRIWQRHLLNCAVVGELAPSEARVVDVGSGAGLPGIVLALARPDLRIVLLEPMERRVAFLSMTVARLNLVRVTIVRARAEEHGHGRGAARLDFADVVTARAVAPLERLARWCLPLVVIGGRMLAIKGGAAAEEAATARGAIARMGGSTPVVRRCGVGLIEQPTTVVEIIHEWTAVTGTVSPQPRRARS